MADKNKIRVNLRKNRTKPARPKNWTRDFQAHSFADEAPVTGERVRTKGDLSRRRTIVQSSESEPADGEATNMPSIDRDVCRPGRVLRIHGLFSDVEAYDGTVFQCGVRRLLKSLVTDERSIVTTGDRVWFRPSTDNAADREGMIERVEPRHGVLTRESRRREQVLVANVDQIVIVVSLVEPDLKPHLIDRYLAGAQQGGLRPIICLNKADLVPAEALQSLVGAYSQLGVATLLTSATTGQSIEFLRDQLRDKATVFSGQSGVGKSSLLNAIQPGLALTVREVSEVNQKGRHTTTTAQLLKLESGGWVVDTPGVRQLKAWNIRSEEVEGYFSEFRPFVPLCAFPDCTHTHETRCAVLRAVRRQQISNRRYVSYLGMLTGADSPKHSA